MDALHAPAIDTFFRHDASLRESGHDKTYRWLFTITRNSADFHGTVPEIFDVVKGSHQVFAEYGNVRADFSYMPREGFGWMNASFQVGLRLLSPALRNRLERLIPPEYLFGTPDKR